MSQNPIVSLSSGENPGLRLNYRVYYATSEDPEYPAQLIQIDYSKDEEYQRSANGWQSKKFCSYPQEIIVQIMTPMRVKQVQMLSHQYKISSRVELYYYLPPKSLQGAPSIGQIKDGLSSDQYLRIGYFQYNDNSRSDYQAREMKTLHVDVLAQYLKIVLYQPFDNKLNLFQQVGIVSLQLIGDSLDGFQSSQGYDRFRDGAIQLPMPSLDQSRQKYLSVATVKDSELDQIFQDKLVELKECRDRAADQDDYDRAQYLREASDKVKEYGVKVLQLSQLKRVAIENEDYETAKKIKTETEKIKRVVQSIDPERGQILSLATAELKQHLAESSVKLGSFKLKQEPQIKFENTLKDFEVKVKEEAKSNASFISQKNLVLESIQQKPFVKYDDQVIPTLKNGRRRDIDEEMDEYEKQYGSFKNLNKDQSFNQLISDSRNDLNEQEQLENASKLVQFFDKPLVLQLSAPQWQQREQGLQEVIANINVSMGQEGYSAAYNSLIILCMDEKVQQIIVTTVELIDQILTRNKNFKFENTDRVLAFLIDKMVDPKIGKKAEEVFFKYVDSHKLDYFDLVAFIVSKNSSFNVQAQNSIKLISKKLQILHSMTADMEQFIEYQNQHTSPPKTSSKYPSNLNIRKDYPYPEVFAKLLKYIDHPQLEIRELSKKVILEIYQKYGFNQIEDFIAKLESKVLLNLIKYIPEAEPYLRMNEDRMKAANKTNSYGGGGQFGWAPNLQSTAQKQSNAKSQPKRSNIGKGSVSPDRQKKNVKFSELDSKNKKTKGGKDQKKQEVSKVIPKCQFCGLIDKQFADGDFLDNHYLNSCLMLTNCAGCTQIIEIQVVNSHLLKECTEKALYKQCINCKEAFLKDQMEEHKLSDNPGCHPPKPTSQANRCPLCHQDIGPVEQGWKDHLLSKSCPNNDRNDFLD
eukprot:403356849